MRVQKQNIVLLHFTDNEWKENNRMTRQSFITLYSTITTAHSLRHTPLCHLYATAHAQHFPVLLSNPSVYISSRSDNKRFKALLTIQIKFLSYLANSFQFTWSHVSFFLFQMCRIIRVHMNAATELSHAHPHVFSSMYYILLFWGELSKKIKNTGLLSRSVLRLF